MTSNRGKATKVFLCLFLVLSLAYFNALMIFSIITTKNEMFFYIEITIVSFIDLLIIVIGLSRLITNRRAIRFTNYDIDGILNNAPCPNFQHIERNLTADEEMVNNTIDMSKSGINDALEISNSDSSAQIYEDAPDVPTPILSSSSYDIESSFEDLANNLISYAMSQGIKVDYPSVRGLLSAIAANRLVIIRCDNLELIRGFLKCLNSVISSSITFTTVKDDFSNPADLYYQIMNGLRYKSEFIKSLYYAKDNLEGIHFAALENVNLATIDSWLCEIYPILDNIVENHQVILHTRSGDLSLNYPVNLWILAVLSADSTPLNSKFLARNAAFTEIKLESCEPVEIDTNFTKLSYKHLGTLVVGNSERYYISEESFKHLDKIIEYLRQKMYLVFGNKEACSLEDYISTFISMGGSSHEALDGGLASKLIPYILADEASKSFMDDLARMLDKEFGSDNIPLTEQAIRLRRND